MAKLYPGTLLEFEHWFRTEEACRDYLVRLRWPDGFSCPRCGGHGYWKSNRGILLCKQCRANIRPTTGTTFEASHIPLRSWFRIIWWMTNQKSGISALGLQRLLGLGSYETAWTCLHKLRKAMVRPGRDRLEGSVEVDETLIGGRQKGWRGGKTNKTLVGIAVEIKGDRMGRIRVQQIRDKSSRSVNAFVKNSIRPGSKVITDGLPGYLGLSDLGYCHEPTVLDGKGREASAVVLPRVHRVASLLKRWLMGIHQGRVSHKHLASYLDEYTFRFNRRNSPKRGMLFYRLLQNAVQVPSTTYQALID